MGSYYKKGNTIYVDVEEISEKDFETVLRYQKLGFVIETRKTKKPSATGDKFKATTIQNWLKENATKEQQKKYWEVFNAPVYDTKTKKKKINKDGTPRKKGHVAGLAWFRKEFPEY